MPRFLLSLKLLSTTFCFSLFCTIPLYAQLLTATIPAGSQLAQKDHFALSYNNEHEQPDWVAWQLNQHSYGPWKRDNSFRRDSGILEGSAYQEQYRGSGFDRGHLAPASEFSFSQNAIGETFLMSNISPQHPVFNRYGLWRKLELFVKERLLLDPEYFVIAGPILHASLPILPNDMQGRSQVSIPDFFFKAIVCVKCDSPKSIAFIFPNEPSDKDWFDDNFVFSVNELEQRLGLDLFYQLEDSFEEGVESQKDLSQWRLD